MLQIEQIPSINIFYFPRLVEKNNQIVNLYLNSIDNQKSKQLYETSDLIQYYIKETTKYEPLTKSQIDMINDILLVDYIAEYNNKQNK